MRVEVDEARCEDEPAPVDDLGSPRRRPRRSAGRRLATIVPRRVHDDVTVTAVRTGPVEHGGADDAKRRPRPLGARTQVALLTSPTGPERPYRQHMRRARIAVRRPVQPQECARRVAS